MPGTITPNQNIFGPALGVLTPASDFKSFPMGNGNLFYASSDNPLNTSYTVSGEVTYSETNHTAEFINAQNVVSVVRAMTGYGYGNRLYEMECITKAATPQLVGFTPTLIQGGTGTGMDSSTNAVCYLSDGRLIRYGVTLVGVSGLPTWEQGAKISSLYRAEEGEVEFWLNGVTIYKLNVTPNISLIPTFQGSGSTTHKMRINTSSSYPMPPGVFYFR